MSAPGSVSRRLAGSTAWIGIGCGLHAATMPLRLTGILSTRHRRWKRTPQPAALCSRLECLESRELLTFGSLVQAGLTKTPFTNTSDISGQSGTVYLNGEVVEGVGLPPDVALTAVPDSEYQYAYINGVPVLVEPSSRRVRYIYR